MMLPIVDAIANVLNEQSDEEKCLEETEMKELTSGVNFINILRGAFMCADSKSAKKIVKSSVSICTFENCALESCL